MKSQASTRTYALLIVALGLGILIKLLLPAAGGLTSAGVTLLAVFIPTVVLWVGIGSGWPTFLGLTVLALVGIGSGEYIFNIEWGNSVNAVLIPMLIIVHVMIDNGAMQYIAEWILSRRLVSGRPYVFYTLLCLAITVLGTVVYPMILCVMFMQLMEQISISIGYTKKDKFYKASLLIILWMSTIMDAVWPFAKPCVASIIAFMGEQGFEISILDWMKGSIPFCILCIVTSLLTVRFIYKPDVSKFVNYDDAAIRKRLKETPINRAGKISVLSILLVVVSWVAPYLPFLGKVSDYFAGLGVPTAACLAVSIMCFVKGDDGKPIVQLGKALARVDWMLVVFIGGIMFYATNLGSDAYGIVTALKNLISPLTDVMPPVVIIAAGLLVAVFMTQFMSNTVSAIIGASVFIPVLLTYGSVNQGTVVALAILIGCIGNCAYVTYGGSAGAGVVMKDSEIPLKEALPNNVAMLALTYVVTLVAALPLLSMIF